MNDVAVTLSLTDREVSLLSEALDAYEYWQLGEALPRSDGLVFVPGDFEGGDDPFWSGRTPTAEQRDAIDDVQACRSLGERLQRAVTVQ